jgi:hypothetical protein
VLAETDSLAKLKSAPSNRFNSSRNGGKSAARFASEWGTMRWTVRVVAAIAALWIAYAAWPFFAFYGLVGAVQKKDHAALTRHVNFPALRRSLTDQVAETYFRLSGRAAQSEMPSRTLVLSAVTSIADPIVARLISAEALLVLLDSGWPTAVLPDRDPMAPGLSYPSLGNLWQVFVHSDQGLRHFEIGLPTGQPPARQFRLQFRLTAWTWKLAGVELPEEIRIRLARELMKQLERR